MLRFRRLLVSSVFGHGSRGVVSTAPTIAARNNHDVVPTFLNTISNELKLFVFGNSNNTEASNFFDIVNSRYVESMKKAQQTEIDSFLEKTREHYIQRLDEEVTEYMSEQFEHLRDFERREIDNFQTELLNDTKEFSDCRQRECQSRLEEDVRKYQFSLFPPNKEMNTELSLKAEGTGPSPDSSISSYIDRRHHFYEQLLNNETVEFMQKRKLFYEELLQTRLSKMAEHAKNRVEEFQAKREAYYKTKLDCDVEWMSNSFQGHYEKCFLQCFARYAWLFYRQKKLQESDKSSLLISDLVNSIPLSTILDEYEKNTLADAARDIFLKAARTVSN